MRLPAVKDASFEGLTICRLALLELSELPQAESPKLERKRINKKAAIRMIEGFMLVSKCLGQEMYR